MRAIRIPCLLVLLAVFAACATMKPRVLVTPAPGLESIPTTIAVYPLLSTRYREPIQFTRPLEVNSTLRDGGEEEGEGDPDERRERRGIYISPPTESSLIVTGASQFFGDLLTAELAYHGFRIKQLPVESWPGADDGDGNRDAARGERQFYVSMDLLDRLREDFGLEAVLLGNVYFQRAGADPREVEVTAAYVKLVDVETLDVVCHVSFTNEFHGTDAEDVVDRIATELAGMMASEPDPDR